jgi:glucosamine-6-phosphate deaminase
MKIIEVESYEDMSRRAADIIKGVVNSKPDAVLGFATGSTPEGVYKCLIEDNKKGLVDFSKITSFNLDEYEGLDGSNINSYRYFMDHKLFNYINIYKYKTFVPNGKAADLNKECIDYDKKISLAGGIDLQLLGIGSNGHIGFNEPADMLIPTTHVTGLTESTIDANSRFFSSLDQVPRRAVTMGMGSILKARRILLLASGENKADVIARLLQGEISTSLPASMLHMHRDVTLIVDKEAASKIKEDFCA